MSEIGAKTSQVHVLRMTILAMFVAASAAVAAPGAAAEPTVDNVARTVRVTVRRGETNGGGRAVVNTVETVLVDGRGASSLESGWRVPIATGGGETGDEISYQHVGFSLRLRGRVLSGRRVELEGSVEESSLDDRLSTVPHAASPTMRTYHQNLNAVLVEGEPLRVGSFVDASGATSFLEMEVDILD